MIRSLATKFERSSLMQQRLSRGGLTRPFCSKEIGRDFGLCYKLGGLASKRDNDVNKKIRGFFSSILREGTTKGFVKAYSTLLDAIVEEDDEFIRSICEPSLATSLLSAMGEIKKAGKRLVKVMPEGQPNIEVTYTKSCIELNQIFDRANQSPPGIVSNDSDFMEIRGSMSTLKPRSGFTGVVLPFILSVTAEFNTPIHLKVSERVSGDDKLEEVIVPWSNQIHRLTFSIAQVTNISLSDLLIKISPLWIKSKGGVEGTVISDILLGESKYEWRIYDIDDYMKTILPSK